MTLTEEIRRCLRMPTFDNWQWEDEEVLLLLQQMYFDLDLVGKFSIDPLVLRKFLCQVYMNYNEVPFHNFQHCFTVSQMVFTQHKYHQERIRKLLAQRLLKYTTTFQGIDRIVFI